MMGAIFFCRRDRDASGRLTSAGGNEEVPCVAWEDSNESGEQFDRDGLCDLVPFFR
jgi:hypothetical protein